MSRNRRAGAEMVVRRAQQVGPLRADLTADEAIDSLWTLNDSTHYVNLVLDRQWPVAEYQRWLGNQMCAAVLEPGSSPERTGTATTTRG